MTDQEINEAIAKACGWTFGPTRTDGIPEWHRPDGSVCNSGVLPDFCNDLNAMHDAEVLLENEIAEADQYYTTLAELTMADDEELCTSVRYRYLANATARQRAEAFLRTKGLWRE